MAVFVDTSAILALMNLQDTNHANADPVWQRLVAQKETLISTNYVVVETFSLLQNRFGLAAVGDFHTIVAPLLHVQWIDKIIHSTAVQAWLLINLRPLSIVDCVSFTVMRQIGLTTAFAYDAHFQQQGFTCLR